MKYSIPFLFSLFILLSLSNVLLGQNKFSFAYIDSIPVTKGGVQLKDPWVGGFNSPQFSIIDLNNDKKKDLFVFDKIGNTIKTFLNKGTAGNPKYVYAPIYQQYFPRGLDSFAKLADFNQDNREDIFSYYLGSMILHRNTSKNNVPKFEIYYSNNIPATIFGPSNVYCSIDDLPELTDVDDDGDLDILTFHLGGQKVDYFENQTTDSDTMMLKRVSQCWGKFYEHPQNDSIVLFASCKRSSRSSSRHTGSTLSLIDLDGNGAKDLLLGDIESPYVNALYNSGTNDNANMTSVEYGFPVSGTKIKLRSFLGTFLIDVDGDNKRDLIVAPNDRQQGEDINNVWLYKNYGSTTDANFVSVDSTFLTKDFIDHGTGSHPMFTDVDGDGLQDIIVGNRGYFDKYNKTQFKSEFKTRLAFYKNTGTAAEPKYKYITDDFAGLSADALYGAYPAFGDLDDDGDVDMLVGHVDGKITYYKNTSGPSLTPSYSKTVNFSQIGAGPYAAPHLYDLNGDSLLDLIVGEKDGYMKLYLNTGTKTSPIFSNTPAKDKLGGVHLFKPGYNSYVSPFFAKIDSSSTTYLCVGTNFGDVVIYDGIDGNIMGNYNPVDTFRLSGGNISVSLANINSTDSLEMLIGESTGGMTIFGLGEYKIIPDTTKDTTSVRDIVIDNFDDKVNVYPNPTASTLNVEIRDLEGVEVSLSMIDLVGRNVYHKEVGKLTSKELISVSTDNMESGAYFVVIQAGNNRLVKKVIKK